MAKVDPANLVPGAVTRSPGNFLLVNGKNGPYIKKWPKKRSTGYKPGNFYREEEFAIAAAWAADPEPHNMAAAIAAAEGVPMVPRDFITMTAYGTSLTFYDEDGDVWTKYRDVTVNAQLTLDQVTDEVGSLIYRADVGWIGIPLGSAGYVLTNWQGAPAWRPAVGGGAGSVDVQTFTSNGSWNKPNGAKRVQIIMVGGGGGGGSGARRASGTNTSGGAGGGGAAFTWIEFDAADLADTETVTVGGGGGGGAARTTNDQNGNSGSAGGTSSMTAGATTVSAGPGLGGNPGNTAGSVGGAAGSSGRQAGVAGASGSAGANGASATNATTAQCTGGGAGAGVVAVPASRNGGTGGNSPATTGFLANAGTGGTGSTKTNATTGSPPRFRGAASLGGGGGWSNADGTAGDGANGQLYGAGGGGGGSSLNGNNSGKGGDGAGGIVIVVSF